MAGKMNVTGLSEFIIGVKLQDYGGWDSKMWLTGWPDYQGFPKRKCLGVPLGQNILAVITR